MLFVNYFRDIFEFWEDDGEIRIGGRAGKDFNIRPRS